MDIHQRLEDLGLVLSEAPAPAANYASFLHADKLVFISGQLPFVNNKLPSKYKSKVGGEGLSVTVAQGAARICALNILSVLKEACHGDLDKVQQCVRLGGFVNAHPDFTDHSKVINGASDLMVQVFDTAGRHARAAVGCSSLPLGACVEVDAVFYIR